MDEQNNKNVPMPITDAESDELMVVPDGSVPMEPPASQVPAEPTGVVEFDATTQSNDSMRGGYASVKGSRVRKTDNRLVWIVLIVMSVMCIVVGVCSAVLTARFMKSGDKPPVIEVDGKVQQNISAVVAARKSGIVEISCGGLSSSGIAMKRDGNYVLVLTNAHAISQYVMIGIRPLVRFYGEDSYCADVTVLGYNGHYDVAVLKVDAGDLKYTIYDIDGSEFLMTDNDYAEGDYVVSIGNAMGMGIASYDGIISRKSELLECSKLFGEDGKKTVPVFRTTAVINAGMSGCGVYDMKGNLIGLGTYRMSNTAGINTDGGAASADVENTGFATPMSIVYPIYKQIVEVADGKEIGLFSVNTQKSNSSIGWMNLAQLGFDCEYKNGELTVGSVSDGVGNVRSGDVIVKIGGFTVGTDICGVVGTLLRYHKRGTGAELALTLRRGDSTHTVKFSGFKYAI